MNLGMFVFVSVLLPGLHREYVDGEVLPAPALTLSWRFLKRKRNIMAFLT